MKADRVIGVVVAVFGLLVALATARVEVLAGPSTLSARFFPYLVAVVMVLGGALLAARPGKRPLKDVVDQLLDWRGILFASLFVAYALSFRYVDFRLGAWLFTLAAMWVLGSRRWLELGLLPILVAGISYLLFRHGFTVMLPTWN